MSYSFERQQKLRFLVLDKDVTENEEIGYYETNLGNVMGSRNQTMTAELKHDKSSGKRGQIIIRAESVSESSNVVEFQLAGTNLPNKVGGCLGMCEEVAPVHYEVLREVGGNGSNHFVNSFTSIAI